MTTNRTSAWCLLVALALTASKLSAVEATDIAYNKLHLTEQFYCEGAYYGDFNHDGKMDIVSGPYWYAGPDFQERHEVRDPKAFDPKGYSDNFLTYTGDFNGDGWTDILYLPWPGKDASWYENPAGKEEPWTAHPALKNVGNESPAWGDVNGDGRPDLTFNIDGYLGFGTWDPAKPGQPWTFHPISTKGAYQRYTHGVGIGDIDGDGRVDILEAACWWQQPAHPRPNVPWTRHAYKFADEAARMLVYDVDGDGRNDVITAWHCHHYGLVWHRQVRDAAGEIGFERQIVLSPNPKPDDETRISQLHALALVDMDGDGLKDILTGKRFWAHGPKGDVEPDAPAVVVWFKLHRDADGGAHFTMHQIDDNSGVGTQVVATDLNGDKTPDVIVGNKKGTFVFLSQPSE